MDGTIDTLPDDIEALKAMVLAERCSRRLAETVASENVEQADRNEERADRLERLLEELRWALYGRRSEKLSADQLELAFEDIETAIAALEAESDDAAPARPAIRRRRTNRGSLPKHLPRIEVVVEPEEAVCGCGHALHRIGEDVSERLDIVPARLQVIVTRRPKYACRACEGGVIQAPVPARLIEGGLPTEATVAQVLVSKYADHLPLYRQAQIYARAGARLDRSTLAHWVGRAAFELRPIFEHLVATMKGSTKLFMDETPAPVLDPGRGRTKTGYLWALARDDRPWGGSDPPAVAYFYAEGRGGEYGERFLAGFSGILQVDGYAGYKRLTARGRPGGAVTLAYCWAHARRKLYEIARADGSAIAKEGLQRIAALYAIEAEIRGLAAEERLASRERRSKPLVGDFTQWLRAARARVSGKSRLGEALRYIDNHWDGLRVFLRDGRVELDSNAVERSIRPIALNRKNALFAGHDEGGRNWGVIASLVETAKLNDVDPQAYLTKTLERLVDAHPMSRIDELMPWNFRPKD
jgi:transposase